MKKKLLAIMLILTIVCSLFAFVACKDQNEKPSGNAGGNSSANNGSGSSKPQKHTHSYSETFSEDENYHWYAADCGHDMIKDKEEHSWNGGAVTTLATCTTEGVKTFTCKVCSRTKTESIPANGHTFNQFGELTTPQTCTTDGVMTYKCKYCSATSEKVVPATHPISYPWSNDKVYHWRTTSCEHHVISNKSEHKFDDLGICTVCDYDSSNGLIFVLNSDGQSYRVAGIKQKYQNQTSFAIPSEFKGLPVTVLGGAFYGRSNITRVDIPDSIIQINEDAFRNCSSLSYVNIPSSVTSIGGNAFFYCRNLTSIVIPKSVKTVDFHAFNKCENLTIYCEASSRPSGWHSEWNYYNGSVVWGYEGE